jgi:CheY-like chemotaxis protein
MPNKGAIFIIEDDHDDQELLRDVFDELRPSNEVKYFDSCLAVFDTLLHALVKPFLIISDINVPLLNGLELKQKINETECLRKKNIPFIFLTTNPDQQVISQAFDMHVQGYFVKPNTIQGLKDMFQRIIDYWTTSLLPLQG